MRLGQYLRHDTGGVGVGVDHDLAGEFLDREIARHFFAIAELPVGKAGVHEAQIVIEKHQIERFRLQDRDPLPGGLRRADLDARQVFAEPAEAILGVIEDENPPVCGDMKGI